LILPPLHVFIPQLSNYWPKKMVAIEIGRVCKKLTGREAGRYCVVIDVIDEGYTSVTGPRSLSGVKRRKCNILHLEPTETVIEIKKDASDEEVAKALDKADMTEKVKVKLPKPIASEKPKSEKAERPKKAVKEKKAAGEKKAEK